MRHSKVILFDLDDTLYPREAGVMPLIGQRIEAYLCQQMGLTVDQSKTLRQRYLKKYGTTLSGLLVEHNVDPEDYLAFVHDVPLEQRLHASPQLDQMLASISLRQVIFTNSTREHARRVLSLLGVAHHFERIIDARNINYQGKKAVRAHQQALDLLEVPGSACILIEDMLHNLKPAKSLGVATVLIGGRGDCTNNVDYYIPSVLHVGNVVRAWEAQF